MLLQVPSTHPKPNVTPLTINVMTTPPDLSPTVNVMVGAIAGGVVAVMVIAILVLTVVVILLALCLRKRRMQVL